nr:ethylene-responsive transcription factor ERF011-like [Aegilops tauschii subsp. strangulata]
MFGSHPGHSSCGSTRHERSRARGCGGASSSHSHLHGIPDLPPPQRQYINVPQRSCRTWVAEIIDRNAHEKIWVGSFQSAVQAVRQYDIMSVLLHDTDARLNFLEGLPWMEPVDPTVATARERREDREAREHLVASHAVEDYMAELRRHYSKRIETERRLYMQYAAGTRPVIGLSSDFDGGCDGDGGGNGARHDPMI